MTVDSYCVIVVPYHFSLLSEQEGTIQQFATAKRPFLDVLLPQIAESYLLAHALLSQLTRRRSVTLTAKCRNRRRILSVMTTTGLNGS